MTRTMSRILVGLTLAVGSVAARGALVDTSYQYVCDATQKLWAANVDCYYPVVLSFTNLAGTCTDSRALDQTVTATVTCSGTAKAVYSLATVQRLTTPAGDACQSATMVNVIGDTEPYAVYVCPVPADRIIDMSTYGELTFSGQSCRNLGDPLSVCAEKVAAEYSAPGINPFAVVIGRSAQCCVDANYQSP